MKPSLPFSVVCLLLSIVIAVNSASTLRADDASLAQMEA
jgi:hypothetical protein